MDSNRLRRTITWNLPPRVKSDVDTQPGLVSSSSQRSLPNISDLGSSPRDSTSAARTQSYRRVSSEWSDEPLANTIDARDSRVVTRERIMKKKQQEESTRSTDEYSRTTDEERVRRRDSDTAAATEDAPTQPGRGSYTTPSYRSSSTRASTTRISGEVAAADDGWVHQSSYVTEEDWSSSIAELHRDAAAESEESLLECPGASVSRPPSGRCLTTVVDRTPSTSSSTEICRHVCAAVGERETRDDDDATLPCRSVSSMSSASCDATRSTTYHDVATCVRQRPAPPCFVPASTCTPVSAVDRYRRPPPTDSRTCYSRQINSVAARLTALSLIHI